ncbi:ThiF family adenylyltransferase [Agrococcus sp. Ld7]|uniref:ThiF family adenylyltransferase n=1 Tax=Agrococcus sp. Ld7 TaxID=649148 RepID=UPI0038707DD1
MGMVPLVEPHAALSERERLRTARHARLPQLGEIGQRRLAGAHIAIVGAGGLGAPLVLALAAAGVGTLTVIDDDVVELSNLHRQVIHRLRDVGSPKVASAARVAAELSETRVVPLERRLTPANTADALRGAHLVIDGSDSFETRAMVAGACEQLGVPLVWGTIQAFDAQVTVFWNAPPPGVAPVVLADLHPPESVGELPSCAQVGVMGALCLQVGSLMALEAIKLVTGVGESLLGRVLVIDGLRATQREVRLTAARALPHEAPARAREVLADALAGTSVLDVRESDEVASGMIPGARHVPLARVLADPGAAAGGDAPTVVVCHSGARAHQAAAAMRAAGVDAVVLAGGMLAWRAALQDASA